MIAKISGKKFHIDPPYRTVAEFIFTKGWEFDHRYFERIARFCERTSYSLVKKSKSLPPLLNKDRRNQFAHGRFFERIGRFFERIARFFESDSLE